MSEFRETEAGFERDDEAPAVQSPEPERQEGQPAAVKPFQLGQRSDEDIARALYPPAKTAEAESEKPGLEGKPQEPRSETELAEVIYGKPHNEQFAKVADNKVLDVIRDVNGAIRHQAQYHGDLRSMVAGNADWLGAVDLRKVPLRDLEIKNGFLVGASIAGNQAEGIRATWSDLRQLDARDASLKNGSLAFSDVRGIQVSPDTDISNCSFEGALIDEPTLQALQKCKGAKTAKGLGIRVPPPGKGSR